MPRLTKDTLQTPICTSGPHPAPSVPPYEVEGTHVPPVYLSHSDMRTYPRGRTYLIRSTMAAE
ncbi:unnamed protein product, partial [Nesidiocoris tenuis]